jgi:hypothetical protein
MNLAAWLWRIVDWGSTAIMAMVMGIFVWRKLYREFPFFFMFLLATEGASALRFFAIDRGPRTYFYTYWISDILLSGVNLLVAYELFALRLFPKFYKIRVYRYMFIAFVAIIALGAWLSAMESGNKYTTLVIQARVFDFTIVGTMAFLLLLMMVMGREWTQYEFAIASGFVVSNAGHLFASAVWARTHYRQGIIQEIAPITFDIACLFWLYCFWSKERVFNRRGTSNVQPEMVEQARKWQAVLKESILPKKRTP